MFVHHGWNHPFVTGIHIVALRGKKVARNVINNKLVHHSSDGRCLVGGDSIRTWCESCVSRMKWSWDVGSSGSRDRCMSATKVQNLIRVIGSDMSG